MMRLLVIVLLVLPYFLTGCRNSSADVPPEIIPGQDACDNCFMIINEKKYAAAVTLNNGEEKRFDDIGCALAYIDQNKKNIMGYWVFDFLSGVPVPAKKAFFVRSSMEVTPMGSGLLAFSKKAAAETFAGRENSKVLIFNELTNNNLNKE
ncbi:MAG TPA: nitrous oxide reductase accessory protein NosL [Ignavibacteriaceae bacterium]|jgi:copper chaperone NosL|nr:nitrous oxide reductase accessory protein NosL [Ignavibacteriaceae bacterium]